MAKRIIRMSRTGITNSNGDFDWTDALMDAFIAAGSSFFATLTGLGVVGLLDDPNKALIAAGIAAGGSFFAWLVAKRRTWSSKKDDEP